MLKLYNYNGETGEYLGESYARKDPMDQDKYLTPANATTVSPPVVVAGKVRVWNGSVWVQQDDYRGLQIWKTDESGEFSTVSSIGPIPAGWTLSIYTEGAKWNGSSWSPVVENADWNGSVWVKDIFKVFQAKLAEIHLYRDSKIVAGVPYLFPDGIAGVIQTRDLIDARNILTNVATAQSLYSFGITDAVMVFRDTENVIHPMTPLEMMQMGVYVAQKGQEPYTADWAVSKMLEGLTVEQIEDFDIEANWPT